MGDGCVFLPDICQWRSRTLNDVRSRFQREIFSPNCKFAVKCTETVKFLKTFQVWIFLGENGFIEKNLKISKMAKVAIFLQNAYQMISFLENVSPNLLVRFLG